MDLRLSPEQEQLVEAFAALYGKESTPARVRDSEPLGFDKALWERLHEQGVVAMAVAESAGGWGASTLDLALLAEQHGRHVAPAPMIEAQAAARLLARLATPAASAALEAALGGDRLITMALHPVSGGEARLVPAAAVADDVVLLAGGQLVLQSLDAARVRVENMASMPLADVTVGGSGVVLASGAEARAAYEAALDDWLALTASALAGIGGRALEIGVDYVKERRAWGVPIGSFQAISHRLADSAAAVDGARLLALEAAWAADDEPARAGELAAMAFAFAHESARDATYRSLHFHGGYGFMMEYDIQLYYRRARGWANVYAEPELVYRRVADARYGEVTA